MGTGTGNGAGPCSVTMDACATCAVTQAQQTWTTSNPMHTSTMTTPTTALVDQHTACKDVRSAKSSAIKCVGIKQCRMPMRENLTDGKRWVSF